MHTPFVPHPLSHHLISLKVADLPIGICHRVGSSARYLVDYRSVHTTPQATPKVRKPEPPIHKERESRRQETMSQSSTIRTVVRMVNHLCPYAERRFYTATRPTAATTFDFSSTNLRIRRGYPGTQYFYSTSAVSPGRAQPPDHLDDKERHIFDKLVAQLEPSSLEVCLQTVYKFFLSFFSSLYAFIPRL